MRRRGCRGKLAQLLHVLGELRAETGHDAGGADHEEGGGCDDGDGYGES